MFSRSSFKKVVFGALIGLSAFSYQAVAGETPDQHEQHGQPAGDWPGIYNGFPPCDDCIGIKTSLALNQNGSYVLITQNVGKSPREFVEKGKFTWGTQPNTIVLTARKSDVTRQYLIGENTLTQLGKDGEVVSGKLASRYVLHRKDMSQQPAESHGGH